MSDEWSERANKFRFDIKNDARVWSYWLGGTEHYPVDEASGAESVLVFPEIVDIAKGTRSFLLRAVDYLAREGSIRQFLDIGAGMPSTRNTHEVAQAAAPDAKIAYLDNDPVVLAHARAWLTNTTPEGVTTHLEADVREPQALLSSAKAALNLDQPVAVILVAVLGLAAETTEQMHDIVGQLMAGVPSGSYLVLSDGVDDGNERQRRVCQDQNYHLRHPAEFAACFDGLDLVPPGDVPVNLWRPTEDTGAPLFGCRGAVGRKP